jgi:arylsulfatase
VSDKFAGKSQSGLHGDVMMEIDWSVGEVMKTLAKHGLTDNTLVIFTCDNGPWLSYGNHAGSAGVLREGKGTAWEGGTRVPCIMRLPGRIPAGTTSGAMLMTIDLLPTIAHLAGADLPPRKIDGRSVWPLIAGQKDAANPHEAYFSWYANNQLQAVTSGDGRWKLVLPHTYRTLAGRPGGKDGIPAKYESRELRNPELYDLTGDVSEATNVAARHPEIVARLEGLAEQARAELGDTLTNREGSAVREPGRLAAAK